MQKLLYLLLFMAVASPSYAQFRVLFVDDSGDTFGNTEYLASALDSLGYESVYIDAYGSAESPTAEQMSEFDLVIWHTSSWGLGLQLWDGADSDNIELLIYLSQPDANLWLIGHDFFFDRYGAAPVTFQSGDFAYDFLGISKYDVQSYADDGGLGVPVVNPASAQPITGLTDVNWQFTTLWYADGFELRPEATPVYLFGDNAYPLSGKPTGVFYHPEGGGRVLTYGFDLSLANNFNLIRSNVDSVLTWWQGVLSATDSPVLDVTSVKTAPNTFSDRLDIRVTPLQTAPVSIRIYRADGQLVAEVANGDMARAGEETLWQWQAPAGLSAGLYFCTVQSGRQVQTLKVVKM